MIEVDKGSALDAVRHQCGATAVVFLGDSVSDEKAYARLSGPDVGIKVGDGGTLAAYRIADSAEVAAVLSLLCEERRTWLYGEMAPPIERLSMLGNGQSGRPGHSGRPGLLAVRSGPAFGGGVRRPAGRPGRGALLHPAAARRTAARAAVRARDDDRADPLVRGCWSPITWIITPAAPHGSGPGDQRVDPRGGRIRPAAGVRPGAVRLLPAAEGLIVLGTSDPMVLRSPGRPGRSSRTARIVGPGGGRARTGPAGGPGTALRQRGAGPAPRARASAALAVGRLLVPLAGRPVLAGGGAGRRRPVRAHSASPVPRRHRCHPGRRHHLTARADRRDPQLGLPALLAA